MKKKNISLTYFSKNIITVIGIVLVWRGIWIWLDHIDLYLFGGSHMWTALFGVLLGIVILFIPDGDLKEIQKM
jgi:hypothetical protein